jgi:chromosomal replication initiator protein
VLGELELEVPRGQFNAWLQNTHLVDAASSPVRVGVPNTFAKEVVERNFHTQVEQILSRLCDREVTVVYEVSATGSEETRSTSSTTGNSTIANTAATRAEQTQLPRSAGAQNMVNEKFTFDRFVIGSGNRLAAAGAQAVAERPAEAYNPLFIYGGAGLGKTHLLHAISNYVLQDQQERYIVYVTCETFTNEFIRAIKNKRIDEFRDRYRSADIILIDDVQFLSGKEQTQEEFFHTFNAYHEFGKQIVLSSDRPPNSIETLTERLRSRFIWGLLADIQPPDLETRIAILSERAEEEQAFVAAEVLEFLATHLVSNVRELEGALTRLLAFAKLSDQEPTQELAMEVLDGLLFNVRKNAFTPEQILNAVATHFRTPVAVLIGPKRDKTIARPRQIAMHMMREETQVSLPEIGRILGGRDHTTVMYGCDKINKELEHSTELQQEIASIWHILRPAK